MEYRRLGRTGLQVSTVGFGTCQLRLVPRTQAIDTLLKGFDLGVNIVHTAPDYGTAEEIVAEALTHTRAKVIVASQGYDVPGNSDGPVAHFERLFEDHVCAPRHRSAGPLWHRLYRRSRVSSRERLGQAGHGRIPAEDEGTRQARRHLLHDARVAGVREGARHGRDLRCRDVCLQHSRLPPAVVPAAT